MKRSLFLIVIYTVTTLMSFAKDEKDLSLLADSCMTLMRSGKLDLADSICSLLVIKADKLGINSEKGKIYRVAGNVALRKNEFARATDYYQKALKIAAKLKDKEKNELLATTMFNQSLMYYQYGDYETTLTLCLNARDMFIRLKDLKSLAQVDNRIGGTYQVLKQNEKASEYNKLAYDEAIRSGDKEIIGSVLIAYANRAMNNGDTINSLKYYSDAYEKAKEANHPHDMSTAAYDISFFYLNMGDYKRSLEFGREALRCAKTDNSEYDQCDAIYRIGLAYYNMKDFSIARDTLQVALKMAEEMKSKPLKRSIYDVLNFLEAETGNYQKAFEYLGYYTDLSQEILSENDQHQVNFLEARYENARKEALISRLNQQKKFGFSLILLLIMGLVFVYMRYLYRQRISKMKDEEQKKEIIRLRQENQLIATQALLQGETSERIRLSRDLHDGLGGMLSATKLKIANMKGNLTIPEEHVATFNTALEMLDSSIKELRRVAHNLMPESLMKFGLNAALSDFCRSIENAEYHFFGSERRLNDNLEIAIYRIVHELVNNALKHAEAGQINVQVIMESNRTCILVQDNGKGFSPESVEGKINGGLKNIRNRVESFNGRMDLISAPGSGTEVTVEFNV